MGLKEPAAFARDIARVARLIATAQVPLVRVRYARLHATRELTMLRPTAPITLERTDGLVRLEPLRVHHADDLFLRCADESVWRYAVERPADLPAMRAFIERAMLAESEGRELPFAIVERSTGRAIGSTRYLEITPVHECLEIGWTWLGVPWQRTGCNTECKYLLFAHAFDALGAGRVQLKADARNVQSRAAIERIGATYEGTLRKHRICADGFVRDSAYYSVVRAEWPSVRERLAQWIERRAAR